jgi:hypothetical protein
MDQTKKWYESTGVIGGLVAVAGAALNAFGVPIAPTDQAAIVGHAGAVLGGLGGLLAIWGRVRASARIG